MASKKTNEVERGRVERHTRGGHHQLGHRRLLCWQLRGEERQRGHDENIVLVQGGVVCVPELAHEVGRLADELQAWSSPGTRYTRCFGLTVGGMLSQPQMPC
jgi:hypothetical protein